MTDEILYKEYFVNPYFAAINFDNLALRWIAYHCMHINYDDIKCFMKEG